MLVSGLGAGVAALAVPVVATAPATAGQELGGFVTSATATPLRVEVYERTIPLPTEPQGEVNLAYTRSSGTSGPQGQGRASYLWPGAAVGDGFKTIADQLQLPPQVGEQGYPFQVNSTYPGGAAKDKDEPFPGTVMRTSSDGTATVAKAGFSTTGDVAEEGDQPSSSPSPGPGLPTGLPGVPGAPSPKARAAGDPPNDGGLGALSALVQVGSATSVSRSSYATDTITSVGTARLVDLSILGGVITADQLRLTGRTSSNVERSTSRRTVAISGLEVAGTPVTLTEKGLVVGPQGGDLPSLGEEPDKALAELGIAVSLPTVTTSKGRDAQEVRGIQVSIDLAKLRDRVDTSPLDGPLGQVVSQLPDQLGPLKGLLGAPTQARPRLVLVLGDVLTDAAASPAIQVDLPSTGAPVKAGSGGGAPALSGGSPGGGVTGGGAPAAVPAPLAGGQTQEVVPTTSAALEPVASGLPPLGSVPGMLLLLGVAVAGGAGWWLQKVGGVVLGAGAACPHGLDSGVPDLRKA
ncbi:hypothetical protein GCM10009815_16940 [Nocardioides marmoribigeumensis]